MPAVWRIVKRKHAASAFDGNAARRFGGRWNSAGRRAVYVSGSKSLALLEVLVHLDVSPPVPRLVAFTFTLEAHLIERLRPDALPRDWRTGRGLVSTQRVGDEWLASGRSLGLAVPSTIVPEELNYLLNPEHPACAGLRFSRPMPFILEPRLVP